MNLADYCLENSTKTSFFPEPILLQQPFSVGSHEYTLKWDSRCFFQVNPEQNEQLVELVCTKAGNVTGKKILDLFCGMGNFSIPLGLAGAEVTGIELNKHSIQAARKNARMPGYKRTDSLPVMSAVTCNGSVKKSPVLILSCLTRPARVLVGQQNYCFDWKRTKSSTSPVTLPP